MTDDDNQKDELSPRLPCDTLAEALAQLRRPPSPAAVRFKLQTLADTAAQVAAYVDARFVYDRLDLVCGEAWHARFAPLGRAGWPRRPARGAELLHVRCRLWLFGVAREDVGEGADPKAAYSDAVKRAAVQFGVSRALYALRLPWLAAGEADRELRRDSSGGLVLDARTEIWCREMYGRWLAERGALLFGDPLDHRATQAQPPSAPDTAGLHRAA
jgi:hypothetical protein